ncbi:MAG: methylated-DNA--[protein]-cysteine S-methyltransferase [Actinomycetaceae bacterium]|nr:methylated-DNA--[protein]-cysteine S-methyltransferase [Actinomycetaceae bacterium]
MTTRVIESPVGTLILSATQGSLVECSFLCEASWEAEERKKKAMLAETANDEVLDRAQKQLGEYFAATRRSFDVPLSMKGTEFQLQVWHALADIEYGSTITYGQLASRIGRPRAARAVGGALNANPIAIILPCHRVIGSTGSLTGFGGGLGIKRALLALEGVAAIT